jgi:hypothetical protein
LSLDIDECSSSGMNDCHVEANCTNTQGSYICTCKEGYTGDGKDCQGTCKLFSLFASSFDFIPKFGYIPSLDQYTFTFTFSEIHDKLWHDIVTIPLYLILCRFTIKLCNYTNFGALFSTVDSLSIAY